MQPVRIADGAGGAVGRMKKMKTELKPCPFCGANAKLLHSGIEKTRSRDNGDLITSWRVLCQNCGTEQKGGVSEYVFNSDETISLKDPHFDGRSKAINAWNRRAEDGN